MSQNKPKSQTLMTPKFRASFANVWEPRAIMQGQDPVYSIAMLFDAEAQKSPEYAALKKAAQAAAKKKFPDGLPKGFRSPFRDADEKPGMQGYDEGVIFVNAKSKYKPGIVDQRATDIIDKEEFYSGCYARASLTVYAYDTAGNKGVAFGLQNLQKLGDGEAFSGRKAASDEFSAVEGFEEDANGFSDDFNEEGSDDFPM